MQNVSDIAKNIEKLVKEGSFTKAEVVDFETFVVFKQDSPTGPMFHVSAFESMPPEFRIAFHWKKAGDTVGPWKIVSVFDVWAADFSKLTFNTMPKAS